MERNPMMSNDNEFLGDTMNRIIKGIPIEVEKEVEEIIEKEHENLPKGLGYCHTFWHRKKELLKEKGYEWLSPADRNKHIIYD